MNKTVLVTGSSRGLGKEIIKEFAKLGYNCIINYCFSEKDATNLEREIKDKYNVNVLKIKCDISNEDDVKEMISISINTFGKIDVLVNNAGICDDEYLFHKTKESFMKIIEVNLVGTFLVSKYASIKMLENNTGNIINISSTNGIDTNYPESIDYDASKAGIISLTHNFAKQLSPSIRVNCVCPGWMNTDMNKNINIDYKTNEENKILLKRFAEPKEIATVVTFLASENASYINDTIIRVDGGSIHG